MVPPDTVSLGAGERLSRSNGRRLNRPVRRGSFARSHSSAALTLPPSETLSQVPLREPQGSDNGLRQTSGWLGRAGHSAYAENDLELPASIIRSFPSRHG